MQPSVLAKRAWFLLFAAIAVFYLWGLGSLPLVGPDEPRYAEVAREMWSRHDLITPTLGGLPWFEKPPLLYWMMMASYRVFGVTEYAARLGPAICGLLTAGFVYWLGRAIENSRPIEGRSQEKIEPEHAGLGRWSALVWLSSLGATTFSRGASFDIVLTMTVTAALSCFFVAEVRTANYSSPSERGLGKGEKHSDGARRIIIAFYFFAGLSLLAKGLIGFVIIFGVIALYYIIRRQWPEPPLMKSLLWGIPFSLLIAGVWYGPIIARHGWKFIDQFIIQHHFARFISNKYHHPGPIYFYLPVLIGLSVPWTIFFGASLWSSRRWIWRGPAALDRARVFALAWVILPVVFFSFSGSKLTAYILPVLPAVALLVGERIVCFLKDERGEKVLRLTGALLILLAVGGLWYADRRFGVGLYRLGLAALPLFVVGIAGLMRPSWRKPLFVLIAIAAIASSAIALKLIAPGAARTESVRDLLAAAAARGYSTTPVVQLHTLERTAEFYAANRMTYGSDGEPVWFEGVIPVVDAARRNNGLVLCFIPVQFESQLTTYKGAQSEVIADNGRVALVAVRVK